MAISGLTIPDGIFGLPVMGGNGEFSREPELNEVEPASPELRCC